MRKRETKIVAGGVQRARDGSIEQVRAAVEAEYAEELGKAGFWRRIRIRRRMRREIAQRMERIAPKGACY